GPELSRDEHGEHAERGSKPVLVADDGDALVGGGGAGGELQVLGQSVALVLPQSGAEEVEQPDLAAGGDLLAKHRFDGALEVIVLDLPERLEADRARGHVRQPLEHLALLPRTVQNRFSAMSRISWVAVGVSVDLDP